MDKWHVMRLPISEQDMLSILQGQATLADLDLPVDARAVRVSLDFALNGFQILIESTAFEPITLGQEIPMLPWAHLRIERTHSDNGDE